MVKRITGLFLAAVMCVSMAGCSGGEETNVSETSYDTSTSTSQQVLLDAEGVVVTLREITPQGTWGPSLVMEIVNGMDREILLTSSKVSVNGLMIEPLWSAQLAAGETKVSEMEYTDRGSEIMGVVTPQKIEMELTVNDPVTYEDIVSSGTVTIETDANNTFQQVFNNEGNEVYNEGDVRIVSLKPDLSGDADSVRAYFYFENNKNIPLMVRTKDVKLNGQAMEAIFEHSIEPGKKMCKPVRFKASDLAAAGISTMYDLEVAFTFLNDDTWMDVAETPVVEVHFE